MRKISSLVLLLFVLLLSSCSEETSSPGFIYYDSLPRTNQELYDDSSDIIIGKVLSKEETIQNVYFEESVPGTIFSIEVIDGIKSSTSNNSLDVMVKGGYLENGNFVQVEPSTVYFDGEYNLLNEDEIWLFFIYSYPDGSYVVLDSVILNEYEFSKNLKDQSDEILAIVEEFELVIN